MKDLQAFINNIVDIFTTKKSLPNDVMNDFIKYFYFTLDKEIKSNKSEVLKNKYILNPHVMCGFFFVTKMPIVLFKCH